MLCDCSAASSCFHQIYPDRYGVDHQTRHNHFSDHTGQLQPRYIVPYIAYLLAVLGFQPQDKFLLRHCPGRKEKEKEEEKKKKKAALNLNVLAKL